MKNFMAVALFVSAVRTEISTAPAIPVAPTLRQVLLPQLVRLPTTSDAPGHAGRRMLKKR
jgi:hypothetical protein